ncbi:aldehyde dehydrogenase family protein [Moritella marina]|uniref:L-piperidine-6-carboxylate dehydrogenase n=1 Tax=Moritella marina TaxID=90736 RepID=UPI003704B135
MHEAILKTVLGDFYSQDKHYGSAYLGGQRFDNDATVDVTVDVISPNDGQKFVSISHAQPDAIKQIIASAKAEFYHWRSVPAPQRGELVRLFAEKARTAKHQLATIISLEAGKPFQESLGEVQELIDVCDFAVGLSRQLYGLTIATERPNHRMMEQWHPIGPVVIITAFNFPMAVWAWNAAISLICGNSIIWKPSSQTPLCGLACHQLLLSAIKEFGANSELSSIVFGEKPQVEQLVDHKDIALVSATGSCAMGRAVNCRVAARMGRTLLELGGNNAMIVCPSADLELAIRAITFSALGTSGQRCTTLRRLIVHSSLKHQVLSKLEAIYKSVSIGDPFDSNNLMGPLVNQQAIDTMKTSINTAISQGGALITGGQQISNLDNKGQGEHGFYITPAIIDIDPSAEIVQQETFAPLLYVHSYDSLEQALAIQNGVSQGLSSAIFTKDMAEAEVFVSARGSDCGLVNVNIGTSGAEIGGAFGGEKDTGGGRESGSDAWKAYMRRMTNTINYGSELPLAQGISFDMPKDK